MYLTPPTETSPHAPKALVGELGPNFLKAAFSKVQVQDDGGESGIYT